MVVKFVFVNSDDLKRPFRWPTRGAPSYAVPKCLEGLLEDSGARGGEKSRFIYTWSINFFVLNWHTVYLRVSKFETRSQHQNFKILGTAGYRALKKFQKLGTAVYWVPWKFQKLGTMGIGYRTEKIFFFSWVPGTDKISIHADPCSRLKFYGRTKKIVEFSLKSYELGFASFHINS